MSETKQCYCGVKGCKGPVFPDCGCCYTTSDDGIHFCQLHITSVNARPKVEEIIGTILRADDAKDYGDWCDWDKLVEKARALKSALGGKAE